jgi:hypothetical protein
MLRPMETSTDEVTSHAHQIQKKHWRNGITKCMKYLQGDVLD